MTELLLCRVWITNSNAFHSNGFDVNVTEHACGRWRVIAIFLYPMSIYRDKHYFMAYISKLSFNAMYTFT